VLVKFREGLVVRQAGGVIKGSPKRVPAECDDQELALFPKMSMKGRGTRPSRLIPGVNGNAPQKVPRSQAQLKEIRSTVLVP